MLTGELDLNRLSDRLRKVDRFILDILSIRLASGGLSDYVAENKRKSSPDGIFNKRRQEVEDERIDNMKKWAKASGVDPNFAASLMYQIISESCRAQDEIMIRKYREKQNTVNEENKEDVYAYQRQELIKLVSKVAAVYDEEYAKGFFGTRAYNEYEKGILCEVITNLPDRTLAIDLGCATGIISFEITPCFRKVIGYDISPEMIAVAKEKMSYIFSHVEFVNIDIEDGLNNLPDNSVSLAVMNMGTASDIRNIEGVIKELRRVLRPDGKFFFSFYNSESLLAQLGFLPWPTSLAAHIDLDKRCLEVHYNSEVFFLYARARSVEEVKNLFSDFEIDDIYTFPTLASILPNVILEDEKEGNCQKNTKAQGFIKEIDMVLAASGIYSGTYIIITGGKIV